MSTQRVLFPREGNFEIDRQELLKLADEYSITVKGQDGGLLLKTYKNSFNMTVDEGNPCKVYPEGMQDCLYLEEIKTILSYIENVKNSQPPTNQRLVGLKENPNED